MTNNSYPLVVGVFNSEAEAKKAIDALRDAGFDRDQIGLALREGGAVTSNLLKDLVNLGVPQERATYYNDEFTAGRPIVSVRADGREQEASQIMANYGGHGDNSQRDYAGTTGAQADTQYATRDTYADQDETHKAMRLREEQLQVNKERVQGGEVRLHKEVVEEKKAIDVPVTHEEVYVERRPLSGGQVSDTPIGADEVVRVPVNEERVNVTKTPVETGEVAIGKRTVQENQRVTDTVRREEPRLERLGDPNVRTNDDLTNS